MIKSFSSIFFLSIAFTLNAPSYASEECQFEYMMSRHKNSGNVCFQVYKNAPYPSYGVPNEYYFQNTGFQRIKKNVMFANKLFEAEYYGGWVFMRINNVNES